MIRLWGVRCLVALCGTLAGLVLAELGLRILWTPPLDIYTLDQYTGVALRPQAAGWYTKEGRAFIKINSQGLRDREHSKKKPPKTLRIAVLGDSYAEALQVPMEEAFWAVMERDLAACPSVRGRTVEAINFGVSGFGTAQELMMLRDRAWDYSPDVVVLAVTTGNDVRNNSRALERDPNRPYFVYRNRKLVLDDSFRREPMFRAQREPLARLRSFVRSHSRVLQLLHYVRVLHSIREDQRKAGGNAQVASSTEVGQEPGLDDTVYLAPPARMQSGGKRGT